jgi:hypothetical protein
MRLIAFGFAPKSIHEPRRTHGRITERDQGLEQFKRAALYLAPKLDWPATDAEPKLTQRADFDGSGPP